MNPNECHHGRLARKCEICELEAEIKELRAEVERLKEENVILYDLAKSNERRGVIKATEVVAKDCAEIADSWRGWAQVAGEAIRKKYGLEDK